MSGTGVAQVKERIQAEFEKARQTDTVKVARFNPRPLRPLAKIAGPAQKAAEDRFKNLAVRHAGQQEPYVVVVPKESAAELYALSERAVSKLNIAPQREERHEVSE
jgi:hypothetical protein